MLEIQRACPEEVGIPSEAILRFLKRLDAYCIPMHSVQIMRKDKLVFEGYYAPCKKGELHRMFSVSKSFTALAIGKLEEEGKISLDAPIIKYFPEYDFETLHPWIKETTIRNMLEMRSCHMATTYKVHLDRNWVESFFVIPPDHKPGTVFHYDTSAAHTMCALVEKLSGKPVLDYLRDTVLREIGYSEEGYFLKDPFGTSMGGSGLMATPEDFLRVGMLLLHKGEINGKQLISRDFLEKATSCQVENMVKGPIVGERQGYGYQIWMGQHGSFMCYGMGGQYIWCFPEQELLVVTTADTQGMGGANQIIQDSFCEEVLTEVSEKELPQNVKACTELQEYANHLEIRSLATWWGKPLIDGSRGRVSGKTYKMQENSQGFEKICLTQEENGEGVLQFVLNGETYRFRFGCEKVVPDTFPLHEMKCASSGLWLDENTFYIRVLLLDEACGSIHIQLYFGEDDLTVFMKKDDEMLYNEFVGHLYGKLF